MHTHLISALINHLYVIIINAWLITPRRGAWTMNEDKQFIQVKG